MHVLYVPIMHRGANLLVGDGQSLIDVRGLMCVLYVPIGQVSVLLCVVTYGQCSIDVEKTTFVCLQS